MAEKPIAEEHRDAALSTFDSATQCSDHRDDSIPVSDLGEVVYYGDNDADEFASVAIFKALSSGYVVAIESSDYTGHGCQCFGSAQRFKTLDNALRLGLSADDAELCGATDARSRAIQAFTEANQ